MIWWGIVSLAVFLIGLTKSGFGSGVGLMITPMAALALSHTPLGSESALGLLLPLLVVGDLIAIWQYRWMFADRQNLLPLRRLFAGTLVGVGLGFLILRWLHSHADLVGAMIRVEIGVESIGLVSLHWWRQWRGTPPRLLSEPWRSRLTGTFAATSSTLAHAAGPIVTMYLLPLKLDRRQFVGVTAVYFFVLNTAKLPAYAGLGLFSHVSPLFSLRFAPLVMLGAVAGLWLNKRLNDRIFSRLVYAITFLLGWYVLYEGVRLVLH